MGTLSGGLFAECPNWHLAKWAALPSAAWKTLGKAAVSVTRRRNGRFSLPSAREKTLGKEGFADALFAEPSLPSVTLGKRLCRVFLRLRRVLQALGEAIDSCSEYSLQKKR
jgi:hypothetical protein